MQKKRLKYLLAIVENRDANFNGETGCPVETVPGGVGRGTGVGLEGDVGPHGRRGRTGLWRRARRTGF